MASKDKAQRRYTAAKKAYKNEDFINSPQARNIRIMCEYEETLLRLKENKIKASVLFFGSARAKDREGWKAEVVKAEAAVAAASDDASREVAKKNLVKWQKCEWMGEQAEKVAKLAELVTRWAVSSDCSLGREHSFQGVTRYHHIDPRYSERASSRTEEPIEFESGPAGETVPGQSSGSESYSTDGDERNSSDAPDDMDPAGHYGRQQQLVVCTGGGPGFMEAANKGAGRVPGSRNMGMGITLPFEDGLNEHVTEELAFEFHYFFTRKFWMLYHCQALVVAPGGFGTLDELFEVLTLKQTGKVQGTLPVILFGKEYWETVVNWQALVGFGTIAQEDVDSLFFTDDPSEAMEFLVNCLSKNGGGHNEEL